MSTVPKSDTARQEKILHPTQGKFPRAYEIEFYNLYLNFTAQNLSEYIFLPKDSEPHTCQSRPITTGPQYDFQEAHCQEGLIAKKLKFQEVLDRSNLVQEYGVQTASTISGPRKNESQRFYRKLDRARAHINLGDLEVPPEFKFISESQNVSLIDSSMDGPRIGPAVSTTFYQGFTDSFHIFFLIEEIKLLETQISGADGTWELTKHLKPHFLQTYFLNVKFQNVD